jgi:hypothetical protein
MSDALDPAHHEVEYRHLLEQHETQTAADFDKTN